MNIDVVVWRYDAILFDSFSLTRDMKRSFL